jgi:hypothetical protein
VSSCAHPNSRHVIIGSSRHGRELHAVDHSGILHYDDIRTCCKGEFELANAKGGESLSRIRCTTKKAEIVKALTNSPRESGTGERFHVAHNVGTDLVRQPQECDGRKGSKTSRTGYPCMRRESGSLFRRDGLTHRPGTSRSMPASNSHSIPPGPESGATDPPRSHIMMKIEYFAP